MFFAVIRAGSDNGCCGCLFMIVVIIVIVASVVGAAKKKAKQAGTPGGIGGSLFGTGGAGGGFISGLAQTIRTGITASQGKTGSPSGKRAPINWNVVKFSMSEKQIRECFDMSALKLGVRKEDLPRYVRLDCMRKYFTEMQIRDMIDLDYFEQAPSPLQQKVKARLKGIIPAPPKAAKATLKEEWQERAGQVISGQALSEETVREKIREEIRTEAGTEARPQPYDSSIDAIMAKLSPSEQEYLNNKISLLGKQHVSYVQLGDISAGIVWSEILRRRTPGELFRGRFYRR